MGYFKRIGWDFWVNYIGKSNLITRKMRFIIYRMMKMDTKTSNINSGVMIRGRNISIGKGSFINHNVYIDAMEKVEIGENVSIAFDVLICTSSHEMGSSLKRAGTSERKPVVIGNGVWIGARSTILPGVTIGDGCMIAAGSVVTKNCEPNGLYAGVPARRVKDLM